jgi:two-component sensor histidine kinase
MSETDALLRELNHRVNNNFQIVVSLMNLKKRILPVERQDDIRFIEEHVQSMAAAYRLIHARGTVLEVPAGELVADVVLGLRLIAKLQAEALSLDLAILGITLNLDQAIAVALYFAAVLPPFLDHAKSSGTRVAVAVSSYGETLSFSIIGDADREDLVDPLRERLLQAFLSQLGAISDSNNKVGQHRLTFVATEIANAV